MKKTFKSIIITAIFIMVLIASSVMTAFADTTYVLDGYTYSVSDNISISLRNWDTSVNTTLTLPDMLANRYFTEVGNWALENCANLDGVDFSNATHLKRIGYESFINCSGIATDLVLPESVETLSVRSFSGCTSIPSITINGNVSEIPSECFYGCTAVTEVVLPDSLHTIQAWAFGGCANLEYIEIPVSVTNIAVSAFLNDPNLTLGVWYGTTGYDYAIAQNIPYILLDGVKLGDANGDGIVNINDVTAIQQHLAEYVFLEGISLHAADADQNGEVKIDDATLLQEFLAEYTVGHPVGEVMTQ